MSLKFKLIILFLIASFIPFAIVGSLIYLDNPHALDELVYFGGLLIIFVVFLGLTLSQIVTDPINSLIQATRVVRGKNLSARVPVNSHDETGELARAFNEMMGELEQTDKVKTEFISLASHYLRTPLSTIRWHLEALGSAGRLTTKQANYVHEAYNANQRMIELVNILLDVSRLETGTFLIRAEKVNVVEHLNGVLKDFEPKIKRKAIKVETSTKLSKKYYNLDPKMQRIILQTLLDNALNYTPDKGQVSLNLQDANGAILLTIKDSGYGIPKKEQSSIFNKLYRATNVRQKVGEGLGLGLYVVKAMVTQIRGQVWFESSEGKGTIFYVKIPLANSGYAVKARGKHD